MDIAVENNVGMGVIRWLFDHFYGCTVSDSAVADAAKHGNLELLQFFKKFGTPADDAEGGDIRLGAGTYPLNQGIRHFVKWGRRDMAYAARYNHPEIVWWLHHNVPVYRWAMVDVVAAAVKNKDMMMVAWVHQNYRVDPESVSNAMQEAVSGGRLDILDWLYDNGYAATTYPLVDDAVVGGNRDVLDWVIDRNLVKPGQVIAVAAKGGNLELATYLYDHYWQKRPHQHYLLVHTRLAHLPTKDSDWISEETMQSAIANGHLEVVQWLYETFADEPEIDLFRVTPRQEWKKIIEADAIDTAARNGHLQVVKYLHELSTLFHQSGEQMRKRGGTRSGTGPTCTAAAMDQAVANNHLAVVLWLHNNREEGCTVRAMDLASSGGHLEMMKWLQANRSLGFTAETLDFAARNGHLEVVKWLHDNKAICTAKALDDAAGQGHLDVVKWLHENRTEGRTTDAMDFASRFDKLDVVKWLHRNRSEGCTTAAIDLAAAKAHSEVVKFLHAHRSEGCTGAAMNGAADCGAFGLILFLHAYRHEGCTQRAFEWTAPEDIYKWLQDPYSDLEPQNDFYVVLLIG